MVALEFNRFGDDGSERTGEGTDGPDGPEQNTAVQILALRVFVYTPPCWRAINCVPRAEIRFANPDSHLFVAPKNPQP